MFELHSRRNRNQLVSVQRKFPWLAQAAGDPGTQEPDGQEPTRAATSKILCRGEACDSDAESDCDCDERELPNTLRDTLQDDDSSSDPDDVIKIEDSLLMDPFYTDAQPRDDSPELDAPADSCKDCDQLVAFQDEDSTDDTQTTLTFGDFAAAESSSDVDSEVWAVSVDQDLGGAKSATVATQ